MKKIGENRCYLDFDFNDDDINTLLSGANYQQQVG